MCDHALARTATQLCICCLLSSTVASLFLIHFISFSFCPLSCHCYLHLYFPFLHKHLVHVYSIRFLSSKSCSCLFCSFLVIHITFIVCLLLSPPHVLPSYSWPCLHSLESSSCLMDHSSLNLPFSFSLAFFRLLAAEGEQTSLPLATQSSQNC